MSASDQKTGTSVAAKIANAGDDELAATISSLRRSRELFNTVHGLNLLLATPDHRDLAMRASSDLALITAVSGAT